MIETVLGIIGGSGVYELQGLTNPSWQTVKSPWGEPSDQVRVGYINDLKMVFLPRHGRGHVYSPSDINYCANVDVMKRMGVTDLVSLSACGSLREDYSPGMLILVDQFVDRTRNRVSSFFGHGCVAHVSMANPVSPDLVNLIEKVATKERLPVLKGGTYLAMEGPQFSSLAESQIYRTWKCDVIGMTNMPEAKLAREAEISYATVAMVTDYDSWHPEHGEVDITEIIKTLHQNVGNVQRLVEKLAWEFPKQREPCSAGSNNSLDHAILTAPEYRDKNLTKKLDAVAGRVL